MDTVAEPVKSSFLSCQRRTTGDTGLGMWSAIEPRSQAININRNSGRSVLESSVRQAHIPAPTQPKGPCPLPECPRNTRPFVIGRFPV